MPIIRELDFTAFANGEPSINGKDGANGPVFAEDEPSIMSITRELDFTTFQNGEPNMNDNDSANGYFLAEDERSINGKEGTNESLLEDIKPGMKCESKRLYQNEYQLGFVEWVDEIPDKFRDQTHGSGALWAEFAVLLRTEFVNGQQRLHSIVVQSSLLKAALKQIFAGYPGLFVGKNALELDAPFKAFVHRWDAFTSACDKGDNSETTRHLQLLRSALEPELQEIFATISDFKEHGAIEFDQLWMIFAPGSFVFSTENDIDSVYKLIRTEVRASREERKVFFVLHCFYVDYDGKKFGHALQVLAIAQFEGSSNYTDLAVYPLESHPAKESVVRSLCERGRKFQSFAGVHYRAYDGVARDYSTGITISHHVKGRIVIDSSTYLRFNSWMSPNLSRFGAAEETSGAEGDPAYDQPEGSYIYETVYNNYHRLREDAIIGAANRGLSDKMVNLTDDQLMICRYQIRGYSLKLKMWLEFSVDSVKDIIWNATAFDSLALPGDYKHMLLAFAKSQRSAAAQFDDVIEGKGRGMVMLLEGPPGVGKTLTVESVAEEMQVPLYSISAGQLKTDPGHVQQKLQDAVEIAAAWNALILLDEADIFLEKRSVNDLDRNQLVSVFLQSLEYFDGTIFLTTNRVDCIDPAFESRIHVSLTYPELTKESRRVVWKNFIQMLRMDTSEITDVQLEQFAAYELNGRQIKNMVKMAGLLGAADNGRLKPAHVEAMMRIGQSDKKKNAVAKLG